MNKLFILIIFAVLAGCSNKVSLSCDSEEVTNVVMDTIKKGLQDEFVKLFYRNETSILTRDIAEMTYAEFKAKALQVTNPEAIEKKYITQIDSVIAGFNLSLGDMRLTAKNDTTGSISCAANLLGTYGEKGAIGYTAQLTEDGILYVEVSEL